MSDLIELLSDLAHLEPTLSDWDQADTEQREMSLNFDEEKLEDLGAHHTMSANSAVASSQNDEYFSASALKLVQSALGTTNLIWDHHQEPAHYDDFGSLSQRTESVLDSRHAPFLQANSGFGITALSKSGESRSGAMNANRLQVNSNGNETYYGVRLGIMYGDHVVINPLNQGSPTPQLTDTTLERAAASGPYHPSPGHVSATSAGLSIIPFSSRGNNTQDKPTFPGITGLTSGAHLIWDSAVPTRFAGPSNSDSFISSNATQMKRALAKTSNCTAAGRPQKKAKGDMDPENHEIYRLRQENKPFDDIADILNEVRSANGRPSNLTGNAVYGRYKRNAKDIAAVRGEVYKPCELDLQDGTNLKAITKPVPAGFDDKEDRLLVEAYKYVRENTWLLVSQRLEEMTGRTHDPADCANRYAYL